MTIVYVLYSFALTTKVKDMMDPGFVFVDQERTEYATVVDILAHRMGIPDHTNLRLDQNLTRANLQQWVLLIAVYDYLCS